MKDDLSWRISREIDRHGAVPRLVGNAAFRSLRIGREGERDKHGACPERHLQLLHAEDREILPALAGERCGLVGRQDARRGGAEALLIFDDAAIEALVEVAVDHAVVSASCDKHQADHKALILIETLISGARLRIIRRMGGP